MKIQPISTSFRGLFINRTPQGETTKQVYYRPYSWESNNTSKMALKEKVDVAASKLPDNEEIFTDGMERAISEDILGTVSYLRTYYGGHKDDFSTIIQEPAMNREESLTVLDKKLNAFLGLKTCSSSGLKNSSIYFNGDINQATDEFFNYAHDQAKGFMDSMRSKSANRQGMIEQVERLVGDAKNIYNNFMEYVSLRNSMDTVERQRRDNLDEIKILKEARESGNLIDISRRDVYDPNRPLWNAFNEMKAEGKIIALPHRTISVKDFLKIMNLKIDAQNIAGKAVHAADFLISLKK
jgi:hypothetical protein